MPLEQLNDEQMAILLDFADRCRHLCFGRPPTGEEADIIAYKEWKELARDLNYAGNLPWKSGKEWKMYWTDLKNRTKGKVGTARRRSKFTGAPFKVKLNCWEQRIMELAEIAAKEPRVNQSYDESLESTSTMPDEGVPPKFESTPNSSQAVDQMLPIDMSNGGLPRPEQLVFVSTGTQMPIRPGPGSNEAVYESLQNVPLPTPLGFPPNLANGGQMQPPPPFLNGGQMHPPPPLYNSTAPLPCGDPAALSQLSVALHALARANSSIADALHALCSRVVSNKPTVDSTHKQS